MQSAEAPTASSKIHSRTDSMPGRKSELSMTETLQCVGEWIRSKLTRTELDNADLSQRFQVAEWVSTGRRAGAS